MLTRHPVAEPAHWRGRLAFCADYLALLDGQPTSDLAARLATELELGLVSAFLRGSGPASEPLSDPVPDPDPHLAMSMDCGATLALAQVSGRRGGFQVELRVGERFWRVPGGPVGFGWPDWLTAFALALVADDGQALAILGTAECIDACAPRAGLGTRIDRFWPLLCGAFAALWQRDASAGVLLDDAEQLLGATAVMEPGFVDATLRPLMPVARALLVGDAAALAGAVLDAGERRRDWYAAETDGARDPDGLYDLPLSALLAEARRRGLTVPATPYGLPDFARAPTPPGQPDEVDCLYPRLAILDAVEAEWLFENEGLRRHDPSTVVQGEDGRLLARYRAFDAPGIPVAELEFELLSAGEAIFDGTHAPPPLDVGELIARAERLASEPNGRDAGGRPVHDLPQAVRALDLAIAYVDTMPGGFDPATLHSAVGHDLYAAEPGRFRRERLAIYRNTLARQAGLAEVPIDASGTAATPGTAIADARDAKAAALALAESMTPLVLPVLQAIAADDSGETIRSLMPREGDYALAFTGEAVAAARRFFADWWQQQGEKPAGIDPSARIDVHLCPAGLLGDDNALSRPFPSGYRQIADWLDPHRIWVAWRYVAPGASGGIAMNGLVWLDDHFAWFPKPWRLRDAMPRH
ncbi:MAG: Imm49 family immunity protein [Bdellovibrio bacteriovorus]